MPDCFLSIAGSTAPTLVAIHGISRNAAEIASRFASHSSFDAVNIIAPLFERKRFGKYQLLQSRSSKKPSSDKALFRLLDHLATEKGIDITKVLLFGFSGGAQMAHRLSLLYPHRVSRLCSTAAGWYLIPDPVLAYPYGLGDGCPVKSVDNAFLDVPTTIIVGSRDTRIDASVRQDPDIVSRQGRNRLDRGRAWVQIMFNLACAAGKEPKVELVTLENGSHDFGLCVRDSGLLEFTSNALLTCMNTEKKPK